MDSRLAARLERLRLLTQLDLAALPQCPVDPEPEPEPEPTMLEGKPAEGGGVSLGPSEDTPSPAVALEHSSRYAALPNDRQYKVPLTGLTTNSSDSTNASAPHTNRQPALSVANKDMVEVGAAPAPSTNGQRGSQENMERRFVLQQGVESSYNLGSKPKLSALPTAASKLPPSDLQRSQLAPECEEYFTPIVTLRQYPWKFCHVNDTLKQEIATQFFDLAKFWPRQWDL